MNTESIWITGPSRSGKTSRLIGHFCEILSPPPSPPLPLSPSPLPGTLVLAATGDNRLDLVDRLTSATAGRYPVRSTTPLGFFESEVMLFWSLLIQELDLKAQFPLRLAPENEQDLAAQLWQAELDPVLAQRSDVMVSRLVRRLLDLLQLASLAGISLTDLPTILEDGLGGQSDDLPLPFSTIGAMLQQWQNWCLERGFLTYGILAALYWQHLLPHATYHSHLTDRFQLLLADDVDEYPAIARSLIETLLDAGATAVLTYNPDGAVRLGLGADPTYLATLADRCRVETLSDRPAPTLANQMGEAVVELVTDPIFFASLPEAFHSIQTTSRAQLLQRTAEVIGEAIQQGQVEPREIAVIAPGMDPIARYSLIEIFNQFHIAAESLNDQRPLTNSPIIRALLTLLTLVYPGLGRMVDRDAVAEMLVVLSQKPGGESESQQHGSTDQDPASTSSTLPPCGKPLSHLHPPSLIPPPRSFTIDPVRAGLLADYCFVPHPDRPRLLPAKTFPRWDRLGYQATTAYDDLVKWIETQQTQLEQRLIPGPVALLDRAIQTFLMGGGGLPFGQVAALRQLIETAQHYWEVNRRLRRGERYEAPAYMTVSRFIQLLRSGAVTANPYPVRPIGPASNAITLANVFQYRSSRRAHRWQFWLDAGSPRWLSGVDALFGAPLFLHEWSGRPWTAADTMASNERRLRRILLDLLSRTQDRVYLCHSELATNGQEQTGVLLSLVNAVVSPQL